MLSEKDTLILEALKKNSRRSVKELSQETGIPRATVFDRIKKLAQAKIIKSFTIEVDHEKIGNATMAFILVKFTSRPNIPQVTVAKNIANLKGIEEVYIVSGTWDIILKARAPTLKELGGLVVDKLRMIEGVEETLTCACFQTIK